MASAAVATDPPSSSRARDFFMPSTLARLQTERKHAYSRMVFNPAYMALQDRIEEFLRDTKLTVTEAASIAGVSPSAVSQWLGKGAKTIHAIGNIEAAINLERRTGYSALWLAKGKGAKKVAEGRSDAPVSLQASLVALGSAITASKDAESRAGALAMLQTYIGNPAANIDLLPLISKRLLGELPDESDADDRKAA